MYEEKDVKYNIFRYEPNDTPIKIINSFNFLSATKNRIKCTETV